MSNLRTVILREELQEIRNKLTIGRISTYIVGMIVIGVGVSLMIRSNIGMSSWDTLHYALTHAISFMSMGLANALTASTTMLLTIILYKRWSYVVMIVPIITTALLINLFNLYIFDGVLYTETWHHIAGYIGGLFLLPLGGSLMIVTTLPAGVYDQFMLAVLYKLKSSRLAFIRAIIEVTVVLLAFLIGSIAGIGLGKFGVGTIIFSLMVGVLISMYLTIFERIGIYEHQQND
ncbi:YczE/YyaS/YitT family protein [Candidatus Xianfuyuplasma coldseepsis]|uniref:YitT family protein n=1 Tax=Candidatus Xianfuyuplasma coldseepsis TaxID=2782163 RepID=A0A7L7KT98_9MOLU|nr:hypothetical protein [Xianfuyuplasma coldseepsis]QMS85835.1 hypothetical protein G4Z02_08775 [Xianfuyuplasma coldseepsis]